MSTTDINTHYGKNIKWTVYRNGYNAFVGTLTLNGAAYDISARTFTAYIRTPSGSANKLTLAEGDGLTNGGAAGTLTVVLTEDDLATLPRDRYFIVIEYPVAGKGDYPLCQGFIEISDETNPGTTTTTATIPVSINGTTVSMAVTLAGGSSLTSSGIYTALGAQTATHFLGGPTPSFRAIGNADVPDRVVGTVYSTDFSEDDLTDYDEFGSLTATISNDMARISGGTSYDDQLRYDFYTQSEDRKKTVRFKVVSGSSKIAIGILSDGANGGVAGNGSVVSFNASSGVILIETVSAYTPTTRATSSALSFSVGDTIELIYQVVDGFAIFGSVQNITTDSDIIYISATTDLGTTAWGVGGYGKPVITMTGGEWDIVSDAYYLNSHYGADVAHLGDSLTKGFYATNVNHCFYSLLRDNSDDKYVKLATGGNKVLDLVNLWPEVLLHKPKTVRVLIGTNDAAASVADATFQTSLNSLIALAEAAAIKVELCTIPHTTNGTVNGFIDDYNTYINTLSSRFLIYDLYTAVTSTHLYSDGTHWVASGHRIAYQTIRNANLSYGRFRSFSMTEWIDWSDSVNPTGLSPITTEKCFYKDDGNTITLWAELVGTSSLTTFTFTLPVKPNENYSAGAYHIPCHITDNGTPAIGRFTLTGGSTTVTVSATIAGGAWTGSGAKACRVMLTYQK